MIFRVVELLDDGGGDNGRDGARRGTGVGGGGGGGGGVGGAAAAAGVPRRVHVRNGRVGGDFMKSIRFSVLCQKTARVEEEGVLTTTESGPEDMRFRSEKGGGRGPGDLSVALEVVVVVVRVR